MKLNNDPNNPHRNEWLGMPPWFAFLVLIIVMWIALKISGGHTSDMGPDLG